MQTKSLAAEIGEAFPVGNPPPLTGLREREKIGDFESTDLYNVLNSRSWCEIGSATITSPYPAFYLLSDQDLSYYLPAILLHIVIEADAFELERLLRRMQIYPVQKQNRDTLRRFHLSRRQSQLFLKILDTATSWNDLGWKERRSIECFLSLVHDSSIRSGENE